MRIGPAAFFAVLPFAVSACTVPQPDAGERRQTGPAAERSSEGDEPPLAALPMRCFESRLPDGSVVSLHYAQRDQAVLGLLDYAFAEKDNARGTFTGSRDGDQITAVWTHQIEGTTQRQEIVLRVADDRITKANGELMEGAGGVLRLKDPAAAAFNETLMRVRCE